MPAGSAVSQRSRLLKSIEFGARYGIHTAAGRSQTLSKRVKMLTLLEAEYVGSSVLNLVEVYLNFRGDYTTTVRHWVMLVMSPRYIPDKHGRTRRRCSVVGIDQGGAHKIATLVNGDTTAVHP